jgi:hypothetical protein
MIFMAKPLRYDTPPSLLAHMVRMWKKPVPYDKDIFIIDPATLRVTRTEGDFYCGNLTRARAK